MKALRALAPVLYPAAAFLSAFLLFFIEPLLAKKLLPSFGGSASVWITSLVFYQVLLVGGYAYAHKLAARPAKAQPWTHAGLLALSLLWIPVRIAEGVTKFSPPASVLAALALAIGVPFLALSSHSPLLQAWWARTAPDKDPYRLSVLSNAGCVVALLGFPLYFEPRFPLPALFKGWCAGYVVLAVLVALCAFIARASGGPSRSEAAQPARSPRVGLMEQSRWLAWSALPSGLLTALTLFLCTQVAPIPLLWTLPLSLYLVTLMIAFTDAGPRFLKPLIYGVPVAGVAWMFVAVAGTALPLLPRLIVHFASFFWITLACHQRMAVERPPADRLTHYFLVVAVGGALGGMAAGLLAPMVFNGLLEFPLFLLLATAAAGFAGAAKSKAKEDRRPSTLVSIGLLAMAAVPFLTRSLQESAWPFPLAVAGAVLLAVAVFRRWPALVGALVGVPLLWPLQAWTRLDRVVFADRSFYGIHRVYLNPAGNAHWLTNGVTTHGGQFLDPRVRGLPFAYYHLKGPLGDIFRNLGQRRPGKRVAICGLGSGAMLAYAQAGETWSYFELDPAVVKIADDPSLFTYMKDTKAKVRTVMGDARLTIAQEPDGSFEMIVLDAFGSDWVPTHLLTKEALAVYLKKLAPGGLLIFHISNQFMDLWPVTAGLAKEGNLHVVRRHYVPTEQDERTAALGSRYVVTSLNEADVAPLLTMPGWHKPPLGGATRLWTDDYSSIAGLMTLGFGE